MSKSFIGIVAALPIEARCLAQQKVSIGDTIALNSNMLLHVAGMGAQRARAAALHLITQGAGALVSWGTAGGLAPSVAAGHLILPDQVIDEHQQVFTIDRPWRDRLKAGLAGSLTIHQGVLLQTGRMISAAAEKQRLYIRHAAIAVDMESAAIAAVAQQSQMRFLAIRSIVDAAHSALPEWLQKSLTMEGEIRRLALFMQLGGQLSRWRALLRISADFNKARSALETAAVRQLITA